VPGRAEPGELAGYDEFYRRMFRILVGGARVLGHTEDDACDLAHEALIGALQQWGSVRRLPEEKRRAYVYRSMVNASHSQARRAKVRRDKQPQLWHPEPIDSAEATALANLQGKAAYKFVQSLPDRQREILLMASNEWTIGEIAEALKIAPKAVRGSLYEARRKIRKHQEGWQ
jgi:RNA polymerase sigma factor (sigma-70 family)